MPVYRITSLFDPSLDIFARLTEAQLRRYLSALFVRAPRMKQLLRRIRQDVDLSPEGLERTNEELAKERDESP